MAKLFGKSLIDNYNFWLFGQGTQTPFKGYISSIDPTTAGTGVLIGGSQNTHKTLLGTIKVRDGLKRRGTANSAIAGVTSSYEWYTSLGAVLPLRVTEENKLQVESDIADGETLVWYDLMTSLDSTRFVFDTWWDDDLKKDTLLFVKFDDNIYAWQGGIGLIETKNDSILLVNGNSASLTQWGAPTGTSSFSFDSNDLTGTSMRTSITFSANPSDGQTLILNINGSLVTFNFVSGIGAVAGNVLIGATAADTITNLRGLINAPGTTNATQVALSGPNQTLVGYLTAPATGNTITLTDDVATQGFPPTGSVTINGTTYAYTGISNDTFTGVTPDPSSEANGSVVLSVIITNANEPIADFSNDFIKVVNNQLNVGSYNSRLIYVSAFDDYIDFTVPATRAPGDPDLLTLDSQARGITVQKGATDRSGNAVISGGLGDWYTIIRKDITVGTDLTEQVDIIRSQTADLSTALAHEFIETIGDNIIFLDQNNQMREFGLVRNIVNPVFPLLSLDVYTELKNRDFTGGHLRAVADENDTTIYITAPNEGIDYMYQIRQKIDQVGNLTAERLWNPPQVRGIARIAVIDGETFGHSNANPQIYQLWNTGQYSDDSPSDTPVPYECHAIFAYISLEGRAQQLQFDKLYYEGYMSQGTFLYNNVYLEYQGSKNILSVTINKPTQPGKKLAKFFSSTATPSLGDVSLGLIPLGEGVSSDGSNNPPKFRAMRRVQPVDVFEFALDLASVDLDSQWEILCLGADVLPSTNRPLAIMA